MVSRFNLMHQIAELDQQLSRSGAGRLPQEQTRTLRRCAEILDSAGEDDEYAICQAIHYLMRKHDLHPMADWPGTHGAGTFPRATPSPSRISEVPASILKRSTA